MFIIFHKLTGPHYPIVWSYNPELEEFSAFLYYDAVKGKKGVTNFDDPAAMRTKEHLQRIIGDPIEGIVVEENGHVITMSGIDKDTAIRAFGTDEEGKPQYVEAEEHSNLLEKFNGRNEDWDGTPRKFELKLTDGKLYFVKTAFQINAEALRRIESVQLKGYRKLELQAQKKKKLLPEEKRADTTREEKLLVSLKGITLNDPEKAKEQRDITQLSVERRINSIFGYEPEFSKFILMATVSEFNTTNHTYEKMFETEVLRPWDVNPEEPTEEDEEELEEVIKKKVKRFMAETGLKMLIQYKAANDQSAEFKDTLSPEKDNAESDREEGDTEMEAEPDGNPLSSAPSNNSSSSSRNSDSKDTRDANKPPRSKAKEKKKQLEDEDDDILDLPQPVGAKIRDLQSKTKPGSRFRPSKPVDKTDPFYGNNKSAPSSSYSHNQVGLGLGANTAPPMAPFPFYQSQPQSQPQFPSQMGAGLMMSQGVNTASPMAFNPYQPHLQSQPQFPSQMGVGLMMNQSANTAPSMVPFNPSYQPQPQFQPQAMSHHAPGVLDYSLHTNSSHPVQVGAELMMSQDVNPSSHSPSQNPMGALNLTSLPSLHFDAPDSSALTSLTHIIEPPKSSPANSLLAYNSQSKGKAQTAFFHPSAPSVPGSAPLSMDTKDDREFSSPTSGTGAGKGPQLRPKRSRGEEQSSSSQGQPDPKQPRTSNSSVSNPEPPFEPEYLTQSLSNTPYSKEGSANSNSHSSSTSVLATNSNSSTAPMDTSGSSNANRLTP